MKDRPKSITVISWYFIIVSFTTVITSYMHRGTPEVVKMMEMSAMSITMQYVLIILGSAIMLASGVLMLKAKGIGRIIYVGWTPIALLIGVITAPAMAMMFPAIAMFIVIAFFIFRPKANEYFSPQITQPLNDS